jgi:hypothetical protein
VRQDGQLRGHQGICFEQVGCGKEKEKRDQTEKRKAGGEVCIPG